MGAREQAVAALERRGMSHDDASVMVGSVITRLVAMGLTAEEAHACVLQDVGESPALAAQEVGNG